MKTALLAGFTLIAVMAGRVEASPQLRNLLTTVQATGTRVVVDDPRNCKDPKVLGYYSYQRNVIDQLTLCVANHRGDSAELYDTILHESVHVAQTCKGGPLFTTRSIRDAATITELKFVANEYSEAHFDQEMEARVIARNQDEVYVTNLIKEHCK